MYVVGVHRDVVQIMSMEDISSVTFIVHKRGYYRLETAKALLEEDIAYSLLYAVAGWKDNGTMRVSWISRLVDLEQSALKKHSCRPNTEIYLSSVNNLKRRVLQ